MDCTSCQRALIDYVYDELHGDERREVSRHLGRCPSCALEFCQHREELDELTRAYAEAPGDHVRQALRAEVERRFRPPLWRRLLGAWTRPVPAYGVAVAGLLPVLVWVISAAAAPEPREPPRAEPTSARDFAPREDAPPPRIAGYDASTVLSHEPGLM
ncbi:MAG: zf-HC2 domain-containing protein [Myxococcales bacterium]|nr:zf-HC2 domain-containing protein [Myxococcales bacterium]